MGLFGETEDDGTSSGFDHVERLEQDKTTKNQRRIIDEEAGVVIYEREVFSTDARGVGLAAVPIEDTDLEIDD